MRSFTALALLSAASLASAEAIESLVRRGSTSEVCACISGEVKLDGFFSGLSAGTLEDEVCLCVSQVSSFATGGNSVCKSGLDIFGQIGLEFIITEKIKGCANAKTCTFPSNSSPACSSRNVCDYSCGSGYTKETINGSPKCSSSSPSARSLPEKRDLVYWGKQTQSSCRTGWEACGIVGGGPRDWECIDTQNDLESCGGCPIDVMSSLTGANGLGVDCTTIPGVSDVSCIAGTCSVNKCMPGFKISRSGQHCELVEELEQEEDNSTVHHSHSHHISHASHKSVHKTTFGNFVEAAVAYLPFSKA